MDVSALIRQLFFGATLPSKTLLTVEVLATLLAKEPRRLKHSLGAERFMSVLAPQISDDPETIDRLLTAALFHDVGHASRLRVTNFHPLDGAIYLSRAQANSDIVEATLFHGAAKRPAATHPRAASVYSLLAGREPSLFCDAVDLCDLRTSPNGKPITVSERVAEVVRRYGPIHPVSIDMKARLTVRKQGIARVLHAISEQAPHSLPWVFVDADGTLAARRRDSAEKNATSICAYRTEGGRISLATDKHHRALLRLAEALDLDDGIHVCGNGAVLLSGGEAELVAPLCNLALPLTTILANVPHVVCALDGIYVGACIEDWHVRKLVSDGETIDPHPIPYLEKVYKLQAFVAEGSEAEHDLREKALRIGAVTTRTSPLYLEFSSPAASKGLAITRLTNLADWPAFHTAAIGNGETDVSMFRVAGRSYAVADASPAALGAADRIVAGCDLAGVSDMLEDILMPLRWERLIFDSES